MAADPALVLERAGPSQPLAVFQYHGAGGKLGTVTETPVFRFVMVCASNSRLPAGPARCDPVTLTLPPTATARVTCSANSGGKYTAVPSARTNPFTWPSTA